MPLLATQQKHTGQYCQSRFSEQHPIGGCQWLTSHHILKSTHIDHWLWHVEFCLFFRIETLKCFFPLLLRKLHCTPPMHGYSALLHPLQGLSAFLYLSPQSHPIFSRLQYDYIRSRVYRFPLKLSNFNSWVNYFFSFQMLFKYVSNKRIRYS